MSMTTTRQVTVLLVLLSASIASGQQAPRLEVRMLGSEFLVKEPVGVTLIFRNPTASPLILPVAATQRHIRFEAADPSGTTSWTSVMWAGPISPAAGPNNEQRMIIPPGGFIALEGNLGHSSGPFPPGTYEVRASYKGSTANPDDWQGEVFSQTVSFVVKAPTDPQDVAGMPEYRPENNERLLKVAPKSRYARAALYRLLRFPFAGRTLNGVPGNLDEVLANITNFCATWPDSPFVPRMRVAQARCLLLTGDAEGARTVVSPYLNPEQDPIAYQEIEALGLVPMTPTSGLALEARLLADRVLVHEPVILTCLVRNVGSSPIVLPLAFGKRRIRIYLRRVPGNYEVRQLEPERYVRIISDLPERDAVTLSPGASVGFAVDLRECSFVTEIIPGEYRAKASYEGFGGPLAGVAFSEEATFSVTGATGEDLSTIRAVVNADGSSFAWYKASSRAAAIQAGPNTVYGRYASFYDLLDKPCGTDKTSGIDAFAARWKDSPLVGLLRTKQARCLIEMGAPERAKALLGPYRDASKFPLEAQEAESLELLASKPSK